MSYANSPKDPILSSKFFGKVVIFSLLIFITASAQTSFFGAFGVFPATPDLLLSAVSGIALFDGERSGAICGIAAGFLADVLGGTAITLLPLFYMLVGYVCGIMALRFLKRNFLSWCVYTLIFCASRAVLTLFYTAATEVGFSFLTLFGETVIPEFYMTFVFALPTYFICRLCASPFHEKNGMR